MTELQQTRGKFKFKGIIKGIEKEDAFKSDVKDGGKNDGKTYRTIRFQVQTSPTNSLTVQAFAYEPDKVYLWNSEKAKEEKEAGGKYKGLRIDFDEWYENRETYREEGYTLLESRLGLTRNEKGKLEQQSLPLFMSILEISESLKDGDEVIIKGDVSHNEYVNRNSEVVKNTQYNLKEVYRTEGIDFEDEKFEEVKYFEDEIIFVEAMLNDETKDEVIVIGRSIDWKGDYLDSEFKIKLDSKDKKVFANNILKKVKFGDFLHVHGDAVNKVIVSEAEPEVDDEEIDPFLASLGGDTTPAHASNYTIREYISELSINGLKGAKQGLYTEEDFASEEEDDFAGSLGGSEDPFAEDSKDEEDPFNVSEDDLPF